MNPVCRSSFGLFRRLSRVTPWHEFFEAVELVVGDLTESPRELGLRIDFVQLGRFNQGEGDGHGFFAAFGASKHPDDMTVFRAGCA